MKHVTVEYPDAADISVLQKGAIVSVQGIPGGRIFAIADIIDPEPIPAPEWPDNVAVNGVLSIEPTPMP